MKTLVMTLGFLSLGFIVGVTAAFWIVVKHVLAGSFEPPAFPTRRLR